jgi:hypothetical protein
MLASLLYVAIVKKSLLHDRSEVVMCGLDGLPLCDFDLQGRKQEPTGDLAHPVHPVIATSRRASKAKRKTSCVKCPNRAQTCLVINDTQDNEAFVTADLVCDVTLE